MELGALRGKGRWLVLGAAVAILAAVLWPRGARGPDGAQRAIPFEDRPRVARVVPEGERIVVEVLNATTIRGLARRATFHLRDAGFDVVGSGNSSERLDSSVVLVRTGRMAWGELAAKALGGARVEARPDTSRYVDLTILLGRTWRPPPETLHP